MRFPADAASGRKWCVRAAVRRGTSRLPRPVRRLCQTGHERLDARLAKTAVMTGWKLTLPCTRDEAEAIGELDVETLGLDPPPTLMTREPDESRPDEWLLEAYFEGKPDAVAVARIGALSALGAPHNLEPLGDEDWVTMSQAGLEPVIAGRFFVKT